MDNLTISSSHLRALTTLAFIGAATIGYVVARVISVRTIKVEAREN